MATYRRITVTVYIETGDGGWVGGGGVRVLPNAPYTQLWLLHTTVTTTQGCYKGKLWAW
jgi:hypothetical protein